MRRRHSAMELVDRSGADDFADQFQFARTRSDGASVFVHVRESSLSDFVQGLCKIALALTVFGFIATGSAIAFNRLSIDAHAASSTENNAGELNRLRAQVAYLAERERALTAELDLLTGANGVLRQLVDRLHEQRRTDAANTHAIRQLYAMQGMIGGVLPIAAETGDRNGSVAVTGTTAEDTPQRVIVTPVVTTETASADHGEP